MGPFTNRPTGIGLIDTLEAVIAVVLVVSAAWGILAWIFQQGKKAARKEIVENSSVSVGSESSGQFEHFLVCDRCAKETDQLLQRQGEPQLCQACFHPPITSSRDNPTTKSTGASG